MPFIGNQPALAYTSFAKQDFTTSATTSYTLDNPVANANEIALFINFVRQEPTTAYTASGRSLTLTSTTSASDDMYCVFLGKAVQTVNPPAGSVGTSQLEDGAITSVKFATGVGGKVGQIKSAIKTDTQSFTTALTFADITDLSIAITPSTTSSKFLVGFNVSCGANTNNQTTYLRAIRDTTPLTVADTAGNRTSGTNVISVNINYDLLMASNTLLDEPSTTSEITYKVQMTSSNTNPAYVNRTGRDFDSAEYDGRAISTMYVMEILP